MIVSATPAEVTAVLAAMRNHPYGSRAQIIGEVRESPAGRVHLRTAMGSLRILDTPSGDILPRIC